MSDDFQERTTSHAKTVGLGHDKTPLDRAADLSGVFEKAKAPREKAPGPQKTESERTTSHAKTIDLGHEKTALDRTPELSRVFDNAQTQIEKSGKLQEKESPGSGSGMVKRDAPSHALTPPSAIRAEPDRQAADARLKQEKDVENKKLSAAQAALKEYRDRMAERGHDGDRDRQRDQGHER